MYIEQCKFYEELEEYSFAPDYYDIMEYSIKAYNEGKIKNYYGKLTVIDHAALNMSLLDLDAARWFLGQIDTESLYQLYRRYYCRM